jgi:hypothetical protein
VGEDIIDRPRLKTTSIKRLFATHIDLYLLVTDISQIGYCCGGVDATLFWLCLLG